MKSLDSDLGGGRMVSDVEGSAPVQPIGLFARAAGLSIKALRVYERAGLLPPAFVDPASGYRYYEAPQLAAARAIKSLRAIGMPLREIGGVLTAEPAEAHRLVDEFWRRIEASIAQARTVIASLHALIDQTEEPMSPTLTTHDLRGALDRSVFAISSDAERPILCSVLVQGRPDSTRVVATDSYRLVVSMLPAAGFEGDLLIHRDRVPELAAALQEAADVTFALTADDAVVTAGGRQLRLPLQPGQFPNYEALMEVETRATLVNEVDEMLAAIEGHEGEQVIDLTLGKVPQLGTARLTGQASGDEVSIGLNPTYLSDGLRALPGERVRLTAASDLKPISLVADDDASYRYLLMPIRKK